jgi:hypothetical protein
MLAALAGALTAPAAAHADAFSDVFADYQKDGRIDPCAHSQSDLRAAKGKIPNDIEQYAPDFPQAPQSPTATAEVAAPTATVPSPPGSAQPAATAADGAIVNAAARTADRGASEPPAPLIALAALGALLLLGLLVWGIARFFAWDPAWVAGARHAVQEAGWRAGGLWDDFTDGLRPGRRPPND